MSEIKWWTGVLQIINGYVCFVQEGETHAAEKKRSGGKDANLIKGWYAQGPASG